MERIAEEGYSLNISRYISTAVAETEIVLKDAHADLVEIEKSIQAESEKSGAAFSFPIVSRNR